MTNWGNHKSDTMAKVQHFSGISKRIPFEGFDFYDLFRVTFENSELGRMKRLLPLHEMAVNFGLVWGNGDSLLITIIKNYTYEKKR